MTTATFQVQGMTCGHCANAVRQEVGHLAGVTQVDVDLPSGTLTVTSAEPVATDLVRGAVDEAGYVLVE